MYICSTGPGCLTLYCIGWTEHGLYVAVFSYLTWPGKTKNICKYIILRDLLPNYMCNDKVSLSCLKWTEADGGQEQEGIYEL